MVVVEGRSRPDTVGIITVFRAKDGLEFSNFGHQFDKHEFAVAFHNNDYCSLLLDLKADALALDAALTEQGRARIDAASSVWVIGPGTTGQGRGTKDYSLSKWPKALPFLLRAAKFGRATFVERLMTHYNCDVKSVDKDGNTALHLAGYYGHADVVKTLLDSGLISDLTIKNKKGKTALDYAKEGHEEYGKATDKKSFCPKTHMDATSYTSGTRVNFTTRDGWPNWREVVRLLKAASVDQTQ
jgi:hypothetical protein